MKLRLPHCHDCLFVRLPSITNGDKPFKPVADDRIRCEGDICALGHAHTH